MSGGLAGLLRLQRRLERYYALEGAPDVTHFVREAPEGARETVLVREALGDLEVAILLPAAARRDAESNHATLSDGFLQAVEGVSHYVFLAERARTELPTTQLELELQAEVDKFVILAIDHVTVDRTFAESSHRALYRNVRYLHPRGSEAGDRYRFANDLAARLFTRLLRGNNAASARILLRRFYRSGQAEKIRLASAS